MKNEVSNWAKIAPYNQIFILAALTAVFALMMPFWPFYDSFLTTHSHTHYLHATLPPWAHIAIAVLLSSVIVSALASMITNEHPAGVMGNPIIIIGSSPV